MVRGCQKKIIYLKNTGSEVFDEAYFLISERIASDKVDECDMIEEANRIVNECISLEISKDIRQKLLDFFKRNIIPFFIGITTGIIITLFIK